LLYWKDEDTIEEYWENKKREIANGEKTQITLDELAKNEKAMQKKTF
jgi:hypothetical protein